MIDENVRRPNTKVCSECGKTKVVGPKNWYRNDTCAACYQKRYKLENPRKYRDIKLRHLYGISLEQYEVMLAAQDNKCAICKRPDNKTESGKYQNFAVDHRHSDGKVRGLLCHSCNKNVGVVEEQLVPIQNYLSKY
jgi:cytochrome c551/c552